MATTTQGTIVQSIGAVIDIEFPRVGLIRVDSADDLLLELRASMR